MFERSFPSVSVDQMLLLFSFSPPLPDPRFHLYSLPFLYFFSHSSLLSSPPPLRLSSFSLTPLLGNVTCLLLLLYAGFRSFHLLTIRSRILFHSDLSTVLSIFFHLCFITLPMLFFSASTAFLTSHHKLEMSLSLYSFTSFL